MATPYRNAEIRPEGSPVRLSYWAMAATFVTALIGGALTYVIFQYVAQGWLGYVVGGLVGLFALVTLSEIFKGKLADCPRCATPVELKGRSEGYLCTSCKTFLEIDRGQLIGCRDDRVSERPVFGVRNIYATLPDVCCTCLAPSVRRDKTKVDTAVIEVPYCAEHSRGVGADRRYVYFRSLEFAKRVSELDHVELAGIASPDDHDNSPSTGVVVGLIMTGGAALTYYGLREFDDGHYQIVAASPKGLVLWLFIKLLGRLWLTTILATLAIGFFAMALGSLKPRRKRPIADRTF